jgi:hypothetical protein
VISIATTEAKNNAGLDRDNGRIAKDFSVLAMSNLPTQHDDPSVSFLLQPYEPVPWKRF